MTDSEEQAQFQSTRSARSATVSDKIAHLEFPISIHALREERDARCGAAGLLAGWISIHALREERDNM